MYTVYVYVLDTLADWEIGHVTAELHSRRFFKKDAPQVIVKTVGISKEPVKTMGGLTVTPDCVLDDMEIAETSVLLLPGADTWNDPKQAKVIEKAGALLSAGGTVCGICGATVALAAAGLLDHRPHTSNGAGFLDMFCPGYRGQSFYVDAPSVADGNLITAGMTEIMEPHIPKIPCTPIFKILQFPYFCYPRYLYTSSEFSPLREAKNGKNRP